jgi:hypothetical protein
MGAADERVGELLDRWLASVDLHARYLELDDAAYARVQDWPRHQRPTRWVVDLARARLLELKRQLAERQAGRDAGFAESLELMAFLTNLLGSEDLERFIPLAVQPQQKVTPPRAAAAPDATMLAPALARKKAPPPAADATMLAPALTRTKASPPARTPPAPAAPPPTDATVLAPALTRTKAPPPARTPSAAPPPTDATVLAPALGRAKPPPARAAAPPQSSAQSPAAGKMTAVVLSDAVRFLRWGRDWSQLAGLIARLASRPPEEDVARILRRHRAEIEARARDAGG